ncbi:MAG: apolipoprotein N-acyltransferase [Alphaproteobacteria bacterium]|nr:apolipoprotein N-acyltransferase [Alphaproteobacteria bacterium]
MSANIHININDTRWTQYNIDFERIARATLSMAGYKNKTSEVSIVLTGDSELRALNKKYRGLDKPTNVLSFETGDSELLGDIFISFDTVMREVGAGLPRPGVCNTPLQESFANHAAHTVVHGVLHLIGYDHIKDKDADKMESLEQKILKGIRHMAYGIWYKIKLYFLCLVFGAAAAFGFAPFYLWPLTVLGVGGAYWLVFDKKINRMPYAICLMPFAFGAGYAVANFWWILNSIYVDPELAAQFAIWTAPGVLGIALVGGLIFAGPFWLALISRADGWRRPVVFAAAWTFVLWLREWIFTGFPWNPIANAAMPFPLLSNSMALWGALGLTFVIIGLIVAIVDAIAKSIEHRAKSIDFLPIGIFGALLLVGIGYGNYNIGLANRSADSESPMIRIIQPAVSASDKATHSMEALRARAAKNLEQLVELSRIPGAPDIIVWPETSYPYMVVDNEFPPSKILGRPVIAGAMSFDIQKQDLKNSMIIAGPDGKINRVYSKSHLVPFGEYRPLGDIVPTPGQLERGDGPEIINVNGFNFAPAICYEIIFSDSLLPEKSSPHRRAMRVDSPQGGSNFPNAIINITNDTWFGKTPGTHQHLDMTRRHAIEMGLPVVRANYSGISAFINADGRIVSSLPIGVAGILDGRVGQSHITPYRRIGRDWWMIIILAFSAAVVLPRRRRM